jgi:hypothetical protein
MFLRNFSAAFPFLNEEAAHSLVSWRLLRVDKEDERPIPET